MKRKTTICCFSLKEDDVEVLNRTRETATLGRNNSEVIRFAIHSLAQLNTEFLQQKFIQFITKMAKGYPTERARSLTLMKPENTVLQFAIHPMMLNRLIFGQNIFTKAWRVTSLPINNVEWFQYFLRNWRVSTAELYTPEPDLPINVDQLLEVHTNDKGIHDPNVYLYANLSQLLILKREQEKQSLIMYTDIDQLIIDYAQTIPTKYIQKQYHELISAEIDSFVSGFSRGCKEYLSSRRYISFLLRCITSIKEQLPILEAIQLSFHNAKEQKLFIGKKNKDYEAEIIKNSLIAYQNKLQSYIDELNTLKTTSNSQFFKKEIIEGQDKKQYLLNFVKKTDTCFQEI